MQKLLQPPACHGLHRVLSSYWLAEFHLMKKSAKVQLYFGLYCGMMKCFTDNNLYLFRIFGAQFDEKDRGLSTCKP
jgi:hypothetical protein